MLESLETLRLRDMSLGDVRLEDVRLGDVRLGDIRFGDFRLQISRLRTNVSSLSLTSDLKPLVSLTSLPQSQSLMSPSLPV